MRGAFDGEVTGSLEEVLSLRTGWKPLQRWRLRSAEDLTKKCLFDGVKDNSVDG